MKGKSVSKCIVYKISACVYDLINIIMRNHVLDLPITLLEISLFEDRCLSRVSIRMFAYLKYIGENLCIM